MTNKSFLSIPASFIPSKYQRFILMKEIIANEIKRRDYTKPIKILDVGCGNGYFLKYLNDELGQNHTFIFHGTDIFKFKKIFKFKFVKSNIDGNFPYDSNTFDFIVAGEIIEHLVNTDGFIKEIRRTLKKNGHTIISTPNLSSYFNRFLLLFGFQPYNSEVSTVESGFGLDIVYKVLGRPKIGNKTAGHLKMFTYRAFVDFVLYYKFKIKAYYPVYFSTFRKDNTRIGLIKVFFYIDKFISNRFPSLATGMIFHLTK
ncbi:MAG: class I SAM-dependent methyltransferase [Minisyncoccia bacterium]